MMLAMRFLAAVAFLASATVSFAADVPTASPQDVGLSPVALERVTRFFKDGTADGPPPGAVALIARNGKVGYFEAFGLQDPETKAPMKLDSIFRIYSMTKPITSVAVMQLWEEGRFRLKDPISMYLPAFKDQKVMVEVVDGSGHRTQTLVPVRHEITIQDLLRHTSGLTYANGNSAAEMKIVEAGLKGSLGKSNPMNDLTNAELVEKLGKMPLMFEPGTRWEYGRSTDVLGALVEKVSGMPLDRYFEARIFTPLGMVDTFFNPPADRFDRLAEPGPEGPDKKLADLYDPREHKAFLGGGEGLVSTAADYWRFCQMLLNGGTLGEKRILGRKTIEYMTQDHVGDVASQTGDAFAPGPGYGFGLGFAVRTATGMSHIPGTAGEFNWGGAGGTAFWVDPAEKLVAVMMIQSPTQRLPYRYAFRSLVYQALE